VKDQPERAAHAPAHARNAVTHLDSGRSAQALHRTLLDRYERKRTLDERQHNGRRLPARPLFNQYQFAAVEIHPGPIQQQYGLQWKVDFTV